MSTYVMSSYWNGLLRYGRALASHWIRRYNMWHGKRLRSLGIASIGFPAI